MSNIKALRRFFKRLAIFFCVLLVLTAIAYTFRVSLLQSMTIPLIHNDAPAPADAMFVLSGASGERPQKAANMFSQYPMKIITTGEYIPVDMKAYGLHITAANVNRRIIINAGIDSSWVIALEKGTSTMDESEAILQYCQQNQLHSIWVISSTLHTGRVYRVFYNKFKAAGIQVRVIAAEPAYYTVEEWWKSEEGLLFVNNEYVKSFVYRWLYGI